jgi:UDP-N-acetyl-D-glucosamine dehydrogenase
MLVVLESTVPPGTTRGLLKPLLEASGLAAGEDFYLAFSPERVDPGSKSHPVESIPKLVGGVSEQCSALASGLYSRVNESVHTVSGPEVAELAKVFENTFRFVNIGLVNELALLCSAMDLDVQEVITASSTKPFAFMAHRPGPGVGGRCIPMAPRYLSWVAAQTGRQLPVTEAAIRVNDGMPSHVAERVEALLAQRGDARDAEVLVLGVAYKPNVDDVRGSVAIDVIAELTRRGLRVTYHDPYVPFIRLDNAEMVSEALTESLLERVDCVLLLCPHDNLDYKRLVSASTLIVDPTARLAADGRRIFAL